MVQSVAGVLALVLLRVTCQHRGQRYGRGCCARFPSDRVTRSGGCSRRHALQAIMAPGRYAVLGRRRFALHSVAIRLSTSILGRGRVRALRPGSGGMLRLVSCRRACSQESRLREERFSYQQRSRTRRGGNAVGAREQRPVAGFDNRRLGVDRGRDVGGVPNLDAIHALKPSRFLHDVPVGIHWNQPVVLEKRVDLCFLRGREPDAILA